MSKLKIKTSLVNAWTSLCWWPDFSDCLITSSISQGWPQKKPADHNCWDDGEAQREDLGWQSKDVVWRWHWRQTGRGRRGTGVLRAQCCTSGRGTWHTLPYHQRLTCWMMYVRYSRCLLVVFCGRVCTVFKVPANWQKMQLKQRSWAVLC